MSKKNEQEIAKILLEKKAVALNTDKPYTYVSGIRSPIYCDNRVLTFFPEERDIIVKNFVKKVKKLNPDVIAGTATSAISWAAWIAAKLKKPMVYIRKAGKGYGKDKLIEGGDITGKTVVVIEDLVSTGGSSLNAVKACKNEGGNVIAMAAIFTYEFKEAKKAFKDENCKTLFLTNFKSLTEFAAENKFIKNDKLSLIQEWSKDPSGWGPKYGFPLGEKKN